MKLLVFFYLLIFSYTSFATESLDLLIKLDKGLPLSKRNGSSLGEVVSYIGDVNNDGFNDWAIGLPDAAIYETGARNGKVYIYYGNSSIKNNKNPDLIIIGEEEFDRFGELVANAGDVNNDGYSDILVACRRYVTIYYGGYPMNSDPDVIFMEENGYGFFGVSMSCAGDVNNDGYDDVIIGSKNFAFIYYGGLLMDSNVDVTLKGESERDFFGFCVSKAGDINRDGFDDVIIGAHGYYLNGYDTGRAYIYFGSSDMDTSTVIIFTGENEGDHFGEIVSHAGDVNNDGFADIIVSARRYDGVDENVGRVYIYFGNDSIDAISVITIDGKQTDPYLGNNICSAGDLNKDGFGDLLVSASESNYIFLGGSLMDTNADLILSHSTAITGEGDYNNDGFADIITGDSRNHTNGEEAGCVSLYYGGLQMDVIPDVYFYGEPGFDSFGSNVSCVEDVNNDGYSDVIIGSPFSDEGGFNAGSAYIYFGGTKINAQADLKIIGKTDNANFGKSVSFAGDVNQDGFSDFIVGSKSGEAVLYFGSRFIEDIADLTFSDGKTGSGFGNCVSYAGDFNNDSYDDFLIGAFCDDIKGTNTGRAYIYLGGPSMGTIPEFIFTGEAKLNYFGQSIAYAGDVNNDGFSDVIIGATGYKLDGKGVGRVYVYYGNNFSDSDPDVVITGQKYKRIGYAIANAGDVNNDGYDDIIIGAPYLGAAVGPASYVYIHYGGTNMDAEPDIVIEKKHGFGIAVSSAGNINNDDYDDIMIGDGENVYIYYGSSKMDTIPDIILQSEVSYSSFGSNLSLAGDVNNDGYEDILIGAPDNSSVGYRMGRAYIYSGELKTTETISISTVTKNFELCQNYPNPFNSSTTINFSLLANSHVIIKIYDAIGQEIATLLNEKKTAGQYSIEWSGQTQSSGLYFYKMIAGRFKKTSKMLLLK